MRGDDFIKDVAYWQYAYGTSPALRRAPTAPFLPQFGRFCSGALTDPGQLLNEESGNGYDGQIYFANEETGDNGRAFGVTAATASPTSCRASACSRGRTPWPPPTSPTPRW